MDQLYYDIRKELDANNNFEMTQYMTEVSVLWT